MPSNNQFECGVCTDDYEDKPDNYMVLDYTKVCNDCTGPTVQTLFERAMANPTDWPARFCPGGAVLKPDDFKAFLAKEFIEAYRVKEIEYRTPWAMRIYCKHKIDSHGSHVPGLPRELNDAEKVDLAIQQGKLCGKFVGSKKKIPEGHHELVECKACDGKSHRACGKPLNTTFESHDCVQEQEEDPFRDQTRGKHYQICPEATCGYPSTLGSGCNHVECPCCKTNYCFICGERAEGNSDHWRRGRCPRYNAASAPNAMYDDDVLADPDDVDDLRDPPDVEEDDDGFVDEDDPDVVDEEHPNLWADAFVEVDGNLAIRTPEAARAARARAQTRATRDMEAVARAVVDATPEGVRQRRDRTTLLMIEHHSLAHRVRLLLTGQPLEGEPAWVGVLPRFVGILQDNLDVFTLLLHPFGSTIRNGFSLEQFEARHRRLLPLLPAAQTGYQQYVALQDIVERYLAAWERVANTTWRELID